MGSQSLLIYQTVGIHNGMSSYIMGKNATKGKWTHLHVNSIKGNWWKTEQLEGRTVQISEGCSEELKRLCFRQQVLSQNKGQCLIPGSSCGSKLLRSVFSLYQSKMRPTKGDISVTFASAQATAWAKENSRVMLQWTPCFSSSSLKNN